MSNDFHDLLNLPRRPIDRLLTPVTSFLRLEAASGILLLCCTMVALIWANLPGDLWHSYETFWHGMFSVGMSSPADSEGGGLGWLTGKYLQHDLHWWVNDGLMAIFFFVVGLEIKRELLVGELATVRKASIPLIAAAGGMIAPALIYIGFNLGTDNLVGWAIPSATDIAFAVGVLSLLGNRVPLSLKVFLLALAIVDDIGAVLIIAIFYSGDISLDALSMAGGFVGALVLANRLGIRRPLVYVVLGIIVWLFFIQSGIHPTVAGVVVACTVPSRIRIDADEFKTHAQASLDRFSSIGEHPGDIMTNPRRLEAVQRLEMTCEHAQAPLMRLEHVLHPWVSFLIMPLFALANAGVHLDMGSSAGGFLSPISLGVGLGLILGKQIGVMLATWLAVRGGIGELPAGVNWKQVYGVSWLAGIGFTMAMFVASLAFPVVDGSSLLDEAKVGILAGSLIAGIGGYVILRRVTRPASLAG